MSSSIALLSIVQIPTCGVRGTVRLVEYLSTRQQHMGSLSNRSHYHSLGIAVGFRFTTLGWEQHRVNIIFPSIICINYMYAHT